jgi:hypothetical protein
MYDVELCYLLIMARPEHQAPAEVVSTFINNIVSVVEIFFVRLSVTTTSIFNHHHWLDRPTWAMAFLQTSP